MKTTGAGTGLGPGVEALLFGGVFDGIGDAVDDVIGEIEDEIGGADDDPATGGGSATDGDGGGSTDGGGGTADDAGGGALPEPDADESEPDRIVFGDGDDVSVAGTAADDRIHLGAGDDSVLRSAGDDLIEGGPGLDTYVAGGAFDAFDFARDGEGRLSVSGAGGIDTLVEIERVALSDGVLALDIASVDADFIYRMYDAAFARTPDLPGFAFWVAEVAEGRVGRDELAGRFTASEEFAARYGAEPTDGEFVAALYRNALRREAEPDGLDFWTEVFESGARTREDMLAEFSDSPENVARNATFMEDGYFLA